MVATKHRFIFPWTAKYMRQAWIFNMGDEIRPTGMERPLIRDGGECVVYRVWKSGEQIQAGESDKPKPRQLANQSAQFFHALEVSHDAMLNAISQMGILSTTPLCGFWVEKTGDNPSGDHWRVLYVADPQTPTIDILAVRSRFTHPGRCMFMATMPGKSFRMKIFKEGIDGRDPLHV